MTWRPRRARPGAPPPEVVAAAGLSRGERVLASAPGTDGSWLLGTRSRLVRVGPDGEVGSLPWEDVEDASWDDEASQVQVREAGEFGRPRREWTPTVTEVEPRAFLQLLRERVTASVVLQRHAAVHGRRGLVVACRRSPTGGPLRWTVTFDPGVEPDDPAALAVAEELPAQLRRDLGELADS